MLVLTPKLPRVSCRSFSFYLLAFAAYPFAVLCSLNVSFLQNHMIDAASHWACACQTAADLWH